jgi:pSer/pThr/pTyr-binding forkhead associated (FHA) protein
MAGAGGAQEDTVPRLILRLDDKIVKRYPLGPIVTVGRLPDNAVVIDNPSVSGHHACLSLEGSSFILEDLDSTNGTFVNERRITRHTLRHGEVVKIGNHALEFDAEHGGQVDAHAAAARIVSNPSDTVFLDADKYQALLAMLKETADSDEQLAVALAPEPATADTVGVLRVLEGRANESEYQLQAHTSVIGKADDSLIRLRGWFAPSVAVVITRNGSGYTATHTSGTAVINDEPLTGRCDLKEGDVLRVGGLTLKFELAPALTLDGAN